MSPFYFRNVNWTWKKRVIEDPATNANLERPAERLLRLKGDPSQKQTIAVIERAMTKEAEDVQVIIENLQILSDSTGMPIVQENGQRCFGPPRDWDKDTPPKGSEIFVGKLPREVYEPHLVPLFSSVGPVFYIRLMMDFCGTNRGYCFVQYFNNEDAQKAIAQLDEHEILPGRRIGVMKSVDNCRLLIGGLPKDKSKKQIHKEINNVTEGVKEVISYPAYDGKSKNRGYCYVEYSCHKTAAMARRKLIPGKVTMWGREVSVDWAAPEPSVQALYVRNLSPTTSTYVLRQIFNHVSFNGVENVKKFRDYAFIHFLSKDQADAARIALDKHEVDGSVVEVRWAKPKPRNEERPYRHYQSGSNVDSSLWRNSVPQYSKPANFGYTSTGSGIELFRNPLPEFSKISLTNEFSTLASGAPSDGRKSVQELAEVAAYFKYGDPVYDIQKLPLDNYAAYVSSVELPQFDNGQRLTMNQFFRTAEEAQAASAERMLQYCTSSISPAS